MAFPPRVGLVLDAGRRERIVARLLSDVLPLLTSLAIVAGAVFGLAFAVRYGLDMLADLMAFIRG